MSNLLTALGALIILVFLAMLAGWRWSGLLLGVLFMLAGWRAWGSERSDGS